MHTPAPTPTTDTIDPAAHAYLLAFMFLGMLVGVSNGIAKVVLPLYAASLSAPNWQIGLVGGLQFIGMLLLSLPMGAMIEKHGSRVLFRTGCIAGAALYIFGFSNATQAWQLILGVLMAGLISPMRMVTIQTEFLHLLPRLGPGKAGWQRAANSSGMFFVGPALGALLIGTLGFQATLKVVGAGLLIATLVGERVLANTEPGKGAGAPFKQRLANQLQILRSSHELKRSMSIEFFGQMAMSYFTVFAVLLAIRQFHWSPQQAASLVSMQGAVFVATLLLASSVLARWQEASRYALAFMLLLLAQLPFALPSDGAWLWIAAATLGLGLGIQHTTSIARFAALTQQYGRGKVGGLFSFAGPAGNLIGAVVGGWLAGHFSIVAGFRIIAVIYIGLLFWQRRPASLRRNVG